MKPTLRPPIIALKNPSRVLKGSSFMAPGPKPHTINPVKSTFVRSSTTLQSIRATISVGEKLPEATLAYFDKEGDKILLLADGNQEFTKALGVTLDLSDKPAGLGVRSRRYVLLAEDGVVKVLNLEEGGAFTGQNLNVGDKILLLANGNQEFTKALGVTLDLSDKPAGLEVRSRRYALLAEDGVVKVLNLEEGGAFTVSGVDETLKAL
eukprot:PITA_34417